MITQMEMYKEALKLGNRNMSLVLIASEEQIID